MAVAVNYGKGVGPVETLQEKTGPRHLEIKKVGAKLQQRIKSNFFFKSATQTKDC